MFNFNLCEAKIGIKFRVRNCVDYRILIYLVHRRKHIVIAPTLSCDMTIFLSQLLHWWDAFILIILTGDIFLLFVCFVRDPGALIHPHHLAPAGPTGRRVNLPVMYHGHPSQTSEYLRLFVQAGDLHPHQYPLRGALGSWELVMVHRCTLLLFYVIYTSYFILMSEELDAWTNPSAPYNSGHLPSLYNFYTVD